MEYCKYYIEKKYEDFPKCFIDENCPLVRRCNEKHEWIPLDSMKSCLRKVKYERKEIMKQGKNIVRFVKKGLLYVELYDKNDEVEMVIAIPNPYDYEPKSVEVVEINGEYFVSGFQPKLEEKKQTQPKNKKGWEE